MSRDIRGEFFGNRTNENLNGADVTTKVLRSEETEG